MKRIAFSLFVLFIGTAIKAQPIQQTQKPPLHGKNWMAITGKPLAATAGAIVFNKGGNAVDAALAMLASTCTMWDVLSWGGETQAIIYNPKTGKVISLNAMGVAPTGATPEFFKSKGYNFPPEYGPQELLYVMSLPSGVWGIPLAVNSLYSPNTFCQTIFPVLRLTAVNCPHGGLTAGYPFLSKNRAYPSKT